MPISHDLFMLLQQLPPGRRRVAVALVESQRARSYPEVAGTLGIHLGTVHRHLRRVRVLHPEVYSALMAERARELAERHARALKRAEVHSRAWYWKRVNRRYYNRHGHWPWERQR